MLRSTRALNIVKRAASVTAKTICHVISNFPAETLVSCAVMALMSLPARRSVTAMATLGVRRSSRAEPMSYADRVRVSHGVSSQKSVA